MPEETDTYRFDWMDEGQGNRRRAIRTGSSWKKSLTFLEDDKVTPKNISTWTFQMMVRKTAADSTVILELSTANGKITQPSGGIDGKIQLLLSSSDTAALISLFDEEEFVDEVSIFAEYDLKYTIGSDTFDSIEGQLEIRASNTRS